MPLGFYISVRSAGPNAATATSPRMSFPARSSSATSSECVATSSTPRNRRTDWAARSNRGGLHLPRRRHSYVLDITQLERIVCHHSAKFSVAAGCRDYGGMRARHADTRMIEALQRCGVNRVSLGVQSFVDHEAASVGRMHKRPPCSTILRACAPPELQTSMST